MVFPTEQTIETTIQNTPLQFAPGLLKVFQSPTAPTIDYFKTLPLHVEKQWAVYLLVLEKPQERPKIYVGSGTSSASGVKSRMSAYDRRTSTGQYVNKIPATVDTAMRHGYTITHKCVLAWTALPLPSDRYELRSLFLLLETIFALGFWSMTSRRKDYFMPALCPWDRDTITYDGCCTHFSINEQIFGEIEDALPEEINRIAAERKAAQSRMYIANKGPGVHKANTKKYGEKAFEEQRFKCTVCEIAFRNNARLQMHLKTRLHTGKAAGITKPRTKHYCETCDHSAATAQRLEVHLNGPRHAKKLNFLASSSKLDN